MRHALCAGALLLALTACKVHETSVAETSITGTWIARWPTGQGDMVFTLLLTSPDEFTLSGTCSVVQGPRRLDCELSGTNDDGAVQLNLTGMSGSFQGQRDGPARMAGDIAFNFYTGRVVVDVVEFEKQRPPLPTAHRVAAASSYARATAGPATY